MQRARLSLALWKKHGYDYYGYGYNKPGEVGVGLWNERVKHYEKCSHIVDAHVLPRVPDVSETDHTHTVEDDQAKVREAWREWYKAQEAAGVSDWSQWNASYPEYTYTGEQTTQDTIDGATEYPIPHSNAEYDSSVAPQSYYLPTSDDESETNSLYTVEDFEPPSARYKTFTPRGGTWTKRSRPAVAMADYESNDDTEISFRAGNVVRWRDYGGDGRWRGVTL